MHFNTPDDSWGAVPGLRSKWVFRSFYVIFGIFKLHRILYMNSFRSCKDKIAICLTWANVATSRPNVNAICGTLGEYDASNPPVVLPIPIETSKKVPRHSAISWRQMLRLSVMSATPIIFFNPVDN